MTIRVALIGAGWAARTVHGPALADYRRRRGGIRLAAVCDLDPARADELRAAFGFERCYTSLGELFGAAKLDAAIVAVSVAQNAAVALECVKAGVPALSEKPPALTLRAVRALDRAVRRRRGRLMVGFNRRWTPALLQLGELARQAGPVQSLAGDMRRVRRRDPDFSTTAVHVIDTLRFLADADYARLSIEYGRCGPPVALAGRGQYASYHALGAMTSGATVRLDATPWAGMDLERYTIVAGGRTLVAELNHGAAPDRLTQWADGQEREIPVRLRDRSRQAVDGFAQEVAALLDAVKRSRKAGRGGAQLPGPTVAQTVQSVEIMEALRLRRTRYRK